MSHTKRTHSPETLAKLTTILRNRDHTHHPFRRDTRTIREEKEYQDCGVIGGRETCEMDDRTAFEQILGY